MHRGREGGTRRFRGKEIVICTRMWMKSTTILSNLRFGFTLLLCPGIIDPKIYWGCVISTCKISQGLNSPMNAPPIMHDEIHMSLAGPTPWWACGPQWTVGIQVYIYKYIGILAYKCIQVYKYTCLSMCTCIQVYMLMHMHMHSMCIHVYMYIHILVHVNACMW